MLYLRYGSPNDGPNVGPARSGPAMRAMAAWACERITLRCRACAIRPPTRGGPRSSPLRVLSRW